MDNTAFMINVNGTHTLSANVLYAAPDEYGDTFFNILPPEYYLADNFNTPTVDS